MGAATAALSWLRPPATIVRGAPTPGSRRRRRTRLVAATTGGAVGQIRAAANRVGVGIAADGALAGCVRLHAHLRQGRLVAATTGGAVGQIRAAANRVGVGIAAHLAGARRRRRRRSRRRRRTRLVAATAGGQSDKSGQRPIGLEWGSQPMEHLLDAFACTSPVPRPPCSSNHWRGSRTSQGSGQSGWSGDRSPPCRGPKVATATESAQASDPPCRSNHWRGSRTSQGSGQSGWSGRPIGLEWGSQPTLQGPEGGDGDGVGEGVGPALSQQPLAGQSDKSGQRPIGLEWGSQPMEHSLDAFTARATLASARRSCARPTSSQPSSAAQVPSSARAAAEQTTSALNASLPRAMIQWILLNRG
ncbi:unnamed protein product [Prorocentrum cordatum]|uniref:Uncharacterized protein n=1 Tax=Prorocentrum cordatum TaxID=2364126 RepID=A0ABN9SWW1_9DINO|nr:unnamed protein product [Polarella glacialis]